MSKKLPESTELVYFLIGFSIYFPVNLLIRKGLIPAQLDLLNLLGLIALTTVTLLHVYWKIRRQQSALGWHIAWTVLLGACGGAWVAYKFF